MDILYILGRGSKHDDKELRLSLRCLENNAEGFDRVFIVGNCPDWLQNVVHIPAEDTWTAENNAFQKILKACKNGISDNFILMNDDFFMLKHTNLEFYPDYIRGWLNFRKKTDPYSLSINRTINALRPYCKYPFNYEVHCPIKFNKNKMLLLDGIAEYFKKEDTGLLVRSFYHNVFSDNPDDFPRGRLVTDTKIYSDTWKEQNETGCISTSDDCTQILKHIGFMYPNKSRWEK